jgi:hypothetical protein
MGAFLNNATGYLSARKKSVTRDQRVSSYNATSYMAENDSLWLCREVGDVETSAFLIAGSARITFI